MTHLATYCTFSFRYLKTKLGARETKQSLGSIQKQDHLGKASRAFNQQAYLSAYTKAPY